MARYTYAQLEQLWINAGGDRMLAPMAAAIAEAESGGDSTALNPADNGGTQTSVGLWQVSTGTHSYPQSWTTPAGNAAEAVAKYRAAGGWSPWGTYTSGAYKAFLDGSTPPDPNVPAGGAGAVTTAAGGSSCLIGPLPHTSMCLLEKSQARAMIGGLMMTAGALIILPGIIILIAAGFKASGAQAAVQSAARPLARVPGYGRALRAVT